MNDYKVACLHFDVNSILKRNHNVAIKWNKIKINFTFVIKINQGGKCRIHSKITLNAMKILTAINVIYQGRRIRP